MQVLQTLLDTLTAQEKAKKDFVVSPDNLTFFEGNLMMTQKFQGVKYVPTDHAHGQVASKLDIPKKYYDRMRAEATNLLDENVNHWLGRSGKNLLVRTFETAAGNTARAFLSDSYSMIDNYEVLLETLEAIKQTGIHVQIVGAELSETSMYLKVTCPEIEIDAKQLLGKYARTIEVGTGVISGFILSNSEVGKKAFNITPRAMILACNNGLVVPEDRMRKTHLGGKMDQLGFQENAGVRAANSKLIKEQVKVAVKTFLSKEYLTKIVDKYTQMGDLKIAAPIASVIEVVAKDYSISQARKASILNYFIQGGDTRRMGIVNAITEECQTLEDIDLKNDSEMVAFDVLKNFHNIEQRAFKTEFTTN